MAKKIAGTNPHRTLANHVLSIQDKASKNYHIFGALPLKPELGNKPDFLIGNDGRLYLAKGVANGSKKLRVTVTVEE